MERNTNIILKAQIVIVARAREAARIATEARNVARLQWEAEHKAIFDSATNLAEFVVAEETKLRDMVLANFVQTQDKHPDPNVGIREVDKLGYDPNLALNWAKEHHVALKLDTGIFEKLAKADPNSVPFVTFNKVATATIATVITLEEAVKPQVIEAGVGNIPTEYKEV